MKKLSYLCLLILIITSNSCTKEVADTRLSDFTEPVITGYYQTNENGEEMGAVGIPNVKRFNGADRNHSTHLMVIFPNPAYYSFNIRMETPVPSTTKKIWITRANIVDMPDNSGIDLAMTTMVVGGSPVFQTETNSDHITINVEDVEDGYYRVYVEADDIILYENLVINHAASPY